MREKKTQKKIELSSAAETHKVYVMYEQLKFPKAGCTHIEITDSLPDNHEEDRTEDEEDVDGDLEVGTSSQQEWRTLA